MVVRSFHLFNLPVCLKWVSQMWEWCRTSHWHSVYRAHQAERNTAWTVLYCSFQVRNASFILSLDKIWNRLSCKTAAKSKFDQSKKGKICFWSMYGISFQLSVPYKVQSGQSVNSPNCQTVLQIQHQTMFCGHPLQSTVTVVWRTKKFKW